MVWSGMVDFSFIVYLYVSDLPNVTISTVLLLVLIVTLGKSETYKETIKEKSTIIPYSILTVTRTRTRTYKIWKSRNVLNTK